MKWYLLKVLITMTAAAPSIPAIGSTIPLNCPYLHEIYSRNDRYITDTKSYYNSYFCVSNK